MEAMSYVGGAVAQKPIYIFLKPLLLSLCPAAHQLYATGSLQFELIDDPLQRLGSSACG
jgi:hypothetical protein